MSPLYSDRTVCICCTCFSVAGTAAEAEVDCDVPEDTQLSAEEEEQLQQKMGKRGILSFQFTPVELKSSMFIY